MFHMVINTVAEDAAPNYAHPGDAGADLRSNEYHHIPAGQRQLVGTGIRVAIPMGYVGMVCPRSGLAAKDGITVLNAPGIVDSGYRGEIFVNLLNTGDSEFTVSAGDRIAQLVIVPVARVVFHPVASLDDTERGTGGHGSTGT